jgi:alkylation response protein AidB-like acyl-CoA dehydrogenase
MKKLGMPASDIVHIFSDEVRVPQHDQSGKENKSFFYQMEQFQEERLLARAKYICFLEDVIEAIKKYPGAESIWQTNSGQTANSVQIC